MGAMRLKMTIFKGENSVCRVAFFSDGNDATESADFQKVKQDNEKLWGTTRQKMAIFKG